MGEWVDNPKDGYAADFSFDLVNNRFDATQNFAYEMKDLTIEYIDTLSDTLGALVLPDTDDLDDIEIPGVPSIDYTGRPVFGMVTLPTDWPDVVPTAPTFYPVPDLVDVDIPSLTATTPDFTMPTKPTASYIEEPGEAPSITSIELPSIPDITLPDTPTLFNVIIPDAPDVTIPAFTAEYVDESISVPDGFSWEESPYNSDIWNNMLTDVQDGLMNGGTGLGADVEAQLWERATERQRLENDRAYREAEGYFAARGHKLPPGAMAGRMLEIGTEILQANKDLNIDIAVKQAELAKEHTQFIRSYALDMERVLRAFHESRVNRSLEAAKLIVSSGIDIYNTLVEKQRLLLDKYKTEASVFESKIRAALASVEIFKARVDGAKVTAEVNNEIISLYNAQIAAVETGVKLYATQMEGVKIASEIQQVKLDIFKTEIQAYAERVSAEKTKYEVYATEVNGKQTEAQIYSEQVKAYLAEIQGKEVISNVNISTLDAALRKNNLLIEQYKAELFGYTATIDAVSKKTDALVEGFKAEVAGYSAENEATSTMYSAKIKEIDANISRASLILQKGVSIIDATTQGYLGISTLQSKGLEGISNIGAQMTSAALNAVNASASVGTTRTGSYNQSYNHGENISESHAYNHDTE